MTGDLELTSMTNQKNLNMSLVMWTHLFFSFKRATYDATGLLNEGTSEAWESYTYICKIRNTSKISKSEGWVTSKTNNSMLQVKVSGAYQLQLFTWPEVRAFLSSDLWLWGNCHPVPQCPDYIWRVTQRPKDTYICLTKSNTAHNLYKHEIYLNLIFSL